MKDRMKTLILGLGNELLSDDGVGIWAARALKEQCEGQAEVGESSLAGLALLELLIGYDRVILIDAVKTGRGAPGTLYELTPADLGAVMAPSPHYAGLPELMEVAKALEIEFPREIKIFAIEVEDPYTIGEGLSEPVKRALNEVVQRVLKEIDHAYQA